MNIWQFIFSFLFTRNWHTGEMELSWPRVVLFGGMAFIIILSVVFAYILQTPVVYESLQ